MLQQAAPEDFVIATGEQHSVREFVTLAAKELDIDIDWQGVGVDEKGICRRTGKVLVQVDARYFRPTEVETLLGDPAKARAKLGWTPQHSFADLVKEMVGGDLELARRDATIAREGFKTFQRLE